MCIASRWRLFYIPSLECVINLLSNMQNAAWKCYAYMRKLPGSPCSVSDRKLSGGLGMRHYSTVQLYTLTAQSPLTVHLLLCPTNSSSLHCLHDPVSNTLKLLIDDKIIYIYFSKNDYLVINKVGGWYSEICLVKSVGKISKQLVWWY